MGGRMDKAVWLGHLPRWRQGAVGKAAAGCVFLVISIDRDPGRYVRVEIPVDHARSLAADLLSAAAHAGTDVPASPVTSAGSAGSLSPVASGASAGSGGSRVGGATVTPLRGRDRS